MKARLSSTLLKKLIGADPDLFFDSRVCLMSVVLVFLIMLSLIKDSWLRLRDATALCFPQIARGADGGDR